MSYKRRNKIGRNEKCPCNSGIKYKHCHGKIQEKSENFLPDLSKKFSELEALDIQRKLQQGLGRPIISTEQNDFRIIAVANRVYWGKWKTFHEFLLDYLKIITGSEWGNSELQKPFNERHPILKLYGELCHYQKEVVKVPGVIHSAPFIGAVSFLLWLSYNLYLIAHNAQLQSTLIERIKHIDQFAGANYETYVAAIFIKAGFSLKFEDESDRSTKHCEFVATHIKTGKKYSVEAKFRHRKNLISSHGSENFKLEFRKLLHKALKKIAPYPRIIFIDLDLPTAEITKYSKNDLINKLNKCENDLINGNPAPSAYVFLTNYPFHYDINSSDHKKLYFVDGFKIPDFGNKKTTLREAIASRKKHFPIHELWNSIKTHTAIPSTFDGSIPEFTFSNTINRLKIGNKYQVTGPDGNEQIVELIQAVVTEVNKTATGLCKNDDEQIHIVQFPLTDDEIAAYKKNPDTFFGVYHEQGKNIQHPLEMFDFFMKGHQLLTKEELLTRLKNYPNQADLANKSRDELLEIYCEGITNNMYKNSKNNST